jgi:surface antigen
MKKYFTKTILIASALLMALSSAMLPQVAQAAPFNTPGCWCTDYVAHVFGLTGYKDAKYWNDYLKGLGWVEVGPQVGAVAVMQPSFPGTDQKTKAGHVGIVEAVSNGYITLRQNHNGTRVTKGDVTEYGCANITNVSWGTRVTGRSDIRFWKPGSPPTTFTNGFSQPFLDQNGARANLKVCAANLSGNTVNVLFAGNGKSWTSSQKAPANATCITFYALNGAPLVSHTTYYSRAALNQQPNPAWPIPCASKTGGQGLCDPFTRP